MTDDQWKLFFDFVEDGQKIDVAAERIGYSKGYLYRLRNRNPELAERWEIALTAGRNRRADELEAIAEERARNGSDLMLIFMLKSLAPERFNDRYRKVEGLEKVLRLEDIPGYQQLCDGLVKALHPYPEALQEVVAVLKELREAGAHIEQRTLN